MIFQNFSYLATLRLRKRLHTHTYTHAFIRSETGMMTIGKICRADLPKIAWMTFIDFDICQQNDAITKVVPYDIDLRFKVNNLKY